MADAIRTADKKLRCVDMAIAAGDARVDGAMRVESAPDAGDGSNIYAIADREAGSKGMLIDAFGASDPECSRELYEQQNANRPTPRAVCTAHRVS